MNEQKISAAGESIDFVKIEHKILEFWGKYHCFEKLQVKNQEGPIFRFLDGPITANNPMGVHHAWGRTLKDVFLRYKAMQGCKCNWQNGFDSQGLWVEVEVERELGFKSKRDIDAFGIENFIQKCKERVEKYSLIQTNQSIRLGQWMDWENSYYTNTDENIEGIWYFLKKCQENNWLYQSPKLLSWCPRCGTSLSEHEMTGSYQNLEHLSVFIKLPIIGQNKRALVWTTTPWTLAANVALAVREDIDYCEVEIKGNDQPLLLAQDSLTALEDNQLRVLNVFKGSELVGLQFETCFPELPAQQGWEHKIISWEAIDPKEGTGIVHIAPGCGAEDYELGQTHHLPIIQPVDEAGNYVEGFDWLTGKNTQKVGEMVVERLERSGKLWKSYLHAHSYPVCWRCKTEVIFRLVEEWFINVEEIRPRMLKAAGQVSWYPQYIGKNMEDWLNNMGDWNISRKRYYGLPLPFYPCNVCGKLTVIGSKAELLKLGGQAAKDIPELHRPWIDEVQIKCPGCGEAVSRIPDIGDVWLDAGIVPFSTLGYFRNRKHWERCFPAEWITEMREQVRLWFYSMLFMSVTLEDKPPYEKVLAYESVVAEEGERFSKTGFMIRFEDAVEKMGADTMRYLYCSASVTSNVRFGYNLGKEVRRRLLSLWNVYSFFITYAHLDKPDIIHFEPSTENLTIIDKWLIERANSFLKKANHAMNEYSTPDLIKEFELFLDDLSNWYIRVNRRRFWKTEDSADKRVAYWCLYHALRLATRVIAPIIPFMAEEIWQNAIRLLDPQASVSIHLSRWPEPLPAAADQLLLQQAGRVREIITAALRLRNQEGIKVRQPLSCIYFIVSKDHQAAIEKFEIVLKNELNVKAVQFLGDFDSLNMPLIKLNFQKAGPILKKDVQKVNQLLSSLNEQQKSEIARQFQSGNSITVKGWANPLPPTLFIQEFRPRPGIAVTTENDFLIALDTTLTDDLMFEGLARDVVRQIQVFRKDSGLRVEQRISLHIRTDAGVLQKAIAMYENYIAEETLAENITVNSSLNNNSESSKKIKIADYSLQISMSVY